MKHRPIGIFDSGVGGLTVVREVMKILPQEKLVYFGDTARVPYGSKSEETVIKFSRQIVRFLMSQNVKAMIVACNTISSNAYDILTTEFPLPFVEVVGPGVEDCLLATRNNRVGVIGTEATIRSNAYARLLQEKSPDIKVFSRACPLFVPLAEEGWTSNTVAALTSEMYLQAFADKDIDTLLLGCTHYPLLYTTIQKTLNNIVIVNPAVSTAKKMRDYLISKNMMCESVQEKPVHTFYVSDNTTKFNRICNLVLNQDYNAVQIDIETF